MSGVQPGEALRDQRIPFGPRRRRLGELTGLEQANEHGLLGFQSGVQVRTQGDGRSVAQPLAVRLELDARRGQSGQDLDRVHHATSTQPSASGDDSDDAVPTSLGVPSLTFSLLSSSWVQKIERPRMRSSLSSSARPCGRV